MKNFPPPCSEGLFLSCDEPYATEPYCLVSVHPIVPQNHYESVGTKITEGKINNNKKASHL